MRVATIHRYGDPSVFAIEEFPTPTPVGSQLLVEVAFAGVNPVDWKMREGRNRAVLFGGFPKVLGHDFAGRVVATGPRLSRFRVGDAVHGMQGLAMGAYATHLIVRESIVARIPAGLTMEEAAAIPMTSLTALQALRDVGRLKPGQRLLVNGASGGVGIAAVQIGKILGAHVTGVSSARNLDLVHGLGADRVIDYGACDFESEDTTYDVVLDCVGNKTFRGCERVLAPHGAFVSIATDVVRIVTGSVANLFRRRRDTQVLVAIPSGTNLAWIGEQVAAGRYRAVLDRRFPLSQVREAHVYSQTGRARGKITLAMSDESGARVAGTGN